MRPYHFGEYSLYARDVVLKNDNGTQRIYFFAKNTPKSGALADTGSSAVPQLALSAGAVVLGAGAIALVRRRKAAQH